MPTDPDGNRPELPGLMREARASGIQAPEGAAAALSCAESSVRGRSGLAAGALQAHSQWVKSFRQELWFELPERRQLVNITPTVEQALLASGVAEGLCLVNAMHITASVFINDDEPGLHLDFEQWLERLAPEKPHWAYQHNRTGEDNADAHLKRTVMGREVVIAITEGRLDLGPWERIFYGEFDGKRRKRALVKIIGE